MHARLDRFSGQRGHRVDDPDLADPARSAAGQPGLLGCVTFRQLGGPAAVCLTLWDTEASATRFPGSRAGLAALPAETYAVTDTEEGPAAAQSRPAPGCCTSTARAPQSRPPRRIWPGGGGYGRRSAASAGW